MRKLLLLPLLTIAFAFSGINSAKASHIMGMSITYKYIGNDSFVIICDFFRYCGGSAFNNGTATSAAGMGSGYYKLICMDNGWQVNRNAPMFTMSDVTPICTELSSTQNSCVAGYQTGLLGVQWGIFHDTLAMDSTLFGELDCDNWWFEYTSGARPNGTNYVSQGSFYAYARMNAAEDPHNSSVQFTSAKPIPFFCDGQPVTYNWGAYDPDGDSLWWELDTAWGSYNTTNWFGTSIQYAGTYTGPQPMPGTTIINNLTGQLNFTATIPAGLNFANYAIAVKVKEYDKWTGAYRGEVHRDVQFIVMDSCNNNPPTDTTGISNFQGDGDLLDSNMIVVCAASDSFEFDLTFFDLDTAGNLSVDSIIAFSNIDEILPGATWTVSGSNPVTLHIKWVLQATNQSYVPFNVTVSDGFCPVTGFNVYSYVIKIEPSTFLGPDTAICIVDSIQLNAHGGDTFWWETVYGDPIVVGENFSCETCRDPWIKPTETTMYVVTSNLEEACGNKDTIIVEVFDLFPINLKPVHGGTADTLVYCASDGLDTIWTQSPGGKYLGSGIVNPYAGVFAPDVVNPGSGRDTVVQVIYLLDDTVCANSDTIAIRIKGKPDAGFDIGPFCDQIDTVTLQRHFAGIPTSESWWDADSSANLSNEGLFKPNLYNSPDTVLVFHYLSDSGCVNLDSALVRVTGSYDSSIDSLPKICEGEDVEIYLDHYRNDPGGVWSGVNITKDDTDGMYYFRADNIAAGHYDVTYDIAGDCGTRTTVPLEVHTLPDATIFGADSMYCDNIIDSVQLEAATPDGRWGGSLVELHDGWFVPARLGEGTYTISYELYDTLTTCYNKNVLPVRIARTPVPPLIHGGGPFCQGTILKDLRGDGLLSNTYKWYVWDAKDREEAEEAAWAINPDSVVKPSLGDLKLIGAGNPFEFGKLNTLPYEEVYGTQMSKEGCESGWSWTRIQVLPSPIAKFGAKDSVREANVPATITFINQSEIGADSSGAPLMYYWEFGPFGSDTVTNPTFTFDQIGKYTVKLVADNATCRDSFEYVIILDRRVKFFIPNVFTPNGDNTNDFFDWELEGIMAEGFSLKVYNRWGTKVFETNDINDKWDGEDAFLGGPSPDGTYFYVVQGTEDTNEQDKAEYRGDVTLIRK